MLLITGASGFVGQHILSSAAPDLLENSIPAWHSRSIPGGAQIELSSPTSVRAVFQHYPVSAVLHLAAEARTALCQENPGLAEAVNVDGTRNLLDACSRIDPLPYFLHVSSDMVFRGDAAPYKEDSATDAVSAYGKSKAEAEQRVREYPGKWAIVRPALIYGAPCGGRVSVLSATLDALRSGQGAFFQDEWRTPVFVNDLVALIFHLLATHETGVVHAGGPDRVSRFGFAESVAAEWGIPGEKVNRGAIGDDPKMHGAHAISL